MTGKLSGDKYIGPPKEWEAGDRIKEVDLNRIENNIRHLKDHLVIPTIKIIKEKNLESKETVLSGQLQGNFISELDRVYLFIVKRKCKNGISSKTWRHLVDKNLKLHTSSKNYNSRNSKMIDTEDSKCLYRHLDTEFLLENSREVKLNKIDDFKVILQSNKFSKTHRKRLIIGYAVVRLINDGSARPFSYGPISQVALSLNNKDIVCIEIK